MNSSLQEQLEQVRPLVKTQSPHSAARAAAELHFQGETPKPKGPRVDWDKCCEEEAEKLSKERVKLENAEIRLKGGGDTYIKFAIVGALSTLTASCLFMLKQSCTNSDKSPKFTV